MTLDFMGGDPARHVLGRDEEKPARKYGRKKPKPKAQPLQFEERLLRDIRRRKAEIAPLIAELPRLEKADKALKEIKKNGR